MTCGRYQMTTPGKTKNYYLISLIYEQHEGVFRPAGGCPCVLDWSGSGENKQEIAKGLRGTAGSQSPPWGLSPRAVMGMAFNHPPAASAGYRPPRPAVWPALHGRSDAHARGSRQSAKR